MLGGQCVLREEGGVFGRALPGPPSLYFQLRSQGLSPGLARRGKRALDRYASGSATDTLACWQGFGGVPVAVLNAKRKGETDQPSSSSLVRPQHPPSHPPSGSTITIVFFASKGQLDPKASVGEEVNAYRHTHPTTMPLSFLRIKPISASKRPHPHLKSSMSTSLWTTDLADRQIIPPFIPPSAPSNATDPGDQPSNHSSVIYVVSFSGTVAILLFTACLLIWRASSRERRAERLVRRAGRERRDDWDVVALEIRQAGLDVPASVRERIERKKRERTMPGLWEVEVGRVRNEGQPLGNETIVSVPSPSFPTSSSPPPPPLSHTRKDILKGQR